MITTPPPLHSFLHSLFSEPVASFEQDLIRLEQQADNQLERVTTLVCKLHAVNRHISIVQDNACIHRKTSWNNSCSRDLDLSSSENRWANDASQEGDESSHVPLRRPRRRLSVDYETTLSPTAEHDNRNSTPRCPRRRGTMEFTSPDGATNAPPKSLTPMPQRLGPNQTNTKSRRLSLEETKDANVLRPRFPQRRGSLTCTTEEPETQRTDRMALRPQRRSSLVCSSELPSATTKEDSLTFARSHSSPAVYGTRPTAHTEAGANK